MMNVISCKVDDDMYNFVLTMCEFNGQTISMYIRSLIVKDLIKQGKLERKQVIRRDNNITNIETLEGWIDSLDDDYNKDLY